MSRLYTRIDLIRIYNSMPEKLIGIYLMIIFSAMSTIIQQLHTAIKAGRHDVVEFIMVQNAGDEISVDVLQDEIVMDYISVCSNINTILHVKKMSLESYIKIMVKQCSVGNTDVVKSLLSIICSPTKIKSIDPHYQNELFFRTACKNGHIETACLIAYIHNTDIYAQDNDALQQACKHNHLKVAQWLYNKCPQKISFNTLTKCYNIAKQNNNTDIIDWLLTIHEPKTIKISAYDLANMEKLAVDNDISPPEIIPDVIKKVADKPNYCLLQ